MGERNKDKPRRKSRTPKKTRREFLGLSLPAAVTLGAILAGGLGGVAVCGINSNQEIENTLAEYRKKEDAAEPVIVSFERGFERFTVEARQRIAAAGIDARGRKTLETPLELAQINRSNPDRNIHAFRRKKIEETRSLKTVRATITNPNYFFYGTELNMPGYAAAFAPIAREVVLSNRYNPDNTLDNLVALHEIVHVGQDTEDRQTLPSQTYQDFHGKKDGQSRAIDIYEASAFGTELFMLNLFTEGQFRKDVLKGSGRIDLNTYRELLRAEPSQTQIIDLLARLGYEYFNGMSSLNGIDRRFLGYVANLYKSFGAEVYSRTPTGYVRTL